MRNAGLSNYRYRIFLLHTMLTFLKMTSATSHRQRRIRRLLLNLFFLFGSALVHAQKLADFSVEMRGFLDVEAVHVSESGKIYIASRLLHMAGDTHIPGDIVRLNSDFTVDPTFQTSSLTYIHWHYESISTSGDSIVAVMDWNGSITVLDNEGKIDSKFELDSKLRSVYRCFVVGSNFYVISFYKGSMRLIRLLRNGKIDPTFKHPALGGSYGDVHIRPNGKIVYVGDYWEPDGTRLSGVVQFHQDGTLDEDFKRTRGNYGMGYEFSSVLLPNGNLVLATPGNDEYNGHKSPGIFRIKANGSPDRDFVGPSFDTSSEIKDIVYFSGEGLFILLKSTNYAVPLKVVKLQEDGDVDSGFPRILARQNDFNASFLEPKLLSFDKELVLAGDFDFTQGEERMSLASFSLTGQLLSKDARLSGTPNIHDVAEDQKGRLIVAGDFYEVNGQDYRGLVRLKPDGSLDKTFERGVEWSRAGLTEILQVEVLKSGKILIGGDFHNTPITDTRSGIARLNADGTVDHTFEAPLDIWGWHLAGLFELDNEDILVVGHVRTPQWDGVVKLKKNGGIDETFSAGKHFSKYEDYLDEAIITSDNHLMVLGYNSDTREDYTYRFNLKRGAIDQNFETFVPSDYRLTAGAEVGNKLVRGGKEYGRATTLLISNLNGTGQRQDVVEARHGSWDAQVLDLLPINDKSYLVAGHFEFINDVPRSGIAMMNLKGKVSSSFYLEANRPEIGKLIRLKDSTLLITGRFDQVNGVLVPGLAKVDLTENSIKVVITLENLIQEYDGLPKEVRVTTDPPNIEYQVKYNGSTDLPVEIGTYEVEVEITEENFRGSETGTMEILQPTAQIVLDDLTHVYDGSPKEVNVTTFPPNLEYEVTYDGNVDLPIESGTYAVEVEITEENFLGSKMGAMEILPSKAKISLEDLKQEYDGSPKAITVITDPPELVYRVKYDGSRDLPTEAGTYDVKVVIREDNYDGTKEADFLIAPDTAEVSIFNLEQRYDGAPKSVIVTTVPTGLNVKVLYGGVMEVPFDIGTYEITALVDEANFVGSASATLSIALVLSSSTDLASQQPYPNPASETLFFPAVYRGMNYVMYDGAGKILKSGQLSEANTVELVDLDRGLFWIKLFRGEEEAVFRILKR